MTFFEITFKKYVTFCNPQSGLKAKTTSNLNRQNFWLAIEKFELKFLSRKSQDLQSKALNFSLVLAWASVVHKFQRLSLDQDVGFNFKKQRSS